MIDHGRLRLPWSFLLQLENQTDASPNYGKICLRVAQKRPPSGDGTLVDIMQKLWTKSPMGRLLVIHTVHRFIHRLRAEKPL